MDTVYIIGSIIVLGMLALLLLWLWRGDRADQREWEEEVREWTLYERSRHNRRKHMGIEWAREDFEKWLEGSTFQGLPLGTPGGVQRSYYQVLTRLQAQHAAAFRFREAERVNSWKIERSRIR